MVMSSSRDGHMHPLTLNLFHSSQGYTN